MKCNICHREKTVKASTFARGSGITHKSCGQFEKTADPKFHAIWESMRTRTTNPNYVHYDCYGGRGINSDEFKYFIDFKDAMYDSYLKKKKELGETPSLERKDVDGNYCKDNCEWIRVSEQKSNQRKTVEFDITFPDGHTEHHRDVNAFAKRTGLSSSCIHDLLTGRLKTYKGCTAKRTN